MEVDLPVGLGVGRERQILAGLLPGNACLEPFLVDPPGKCLKLLLGSRIAVSVGCRERLGRALPVAGGLGSPLVVLRALHGVDRQGVAGRILIDAGSAMPDPLPPAVHRHPHDKLQLRHLEGRRVGMPQEVADQLAVVAHLAGAFAVAHARGLHDAAVVSHAVDQRHEAIVENRQLLPAKRVEQDTAVGLSGSLGSGHVAWSVGMEKPTECDRPSAAVNPLPATLGGAWPAGGHHRSP